LGYGVSVFSKPFFALANTWPMVLVIRVLERMGKGLREAPRDALLAESTPHEYLGKAFGIQRAMDSIGGLLGAVIAFYLFPIFGFKNMFLFAAIPGFLAIFMIMFIQEARKERVNTRENMDDRYAKPEISFWQGIKVLPPKLLAFIGISAIFALGNFGYAFLLLKIKHVGGSDVDALLYFVLFTAIDALVSIPAGVLSDRRGRKTILLISYMLFTAVAAVLMLTSTITWTIIAFVAFGIVYSILDGAQRAFVSELAPKEYRATALGMFYTAIGIVALPGGYLLGTLRDKSSPAWMFACSTFIGFIAIIGVALLRRKR
jgi:MFS family permease